MFGRASGDDIHDKARHVLVWVQRLKCPEIKAALSFSAPIFSIIVARSGLGLGVHGPDGPIRVANHCVKLDDEPVLGESVAALEADSLVRLKSRLGFSQPSARRASSLDRKAVCALAFEVLEVPHPVRLIGRESSLRLALDGFVGPIWGELKLPRPSL